MQFAQENDLYLVKLNDGEDLLESLKQLASSSEAKCFAILCGVGMLREVKLGYFVGDGKYDITEFKEPMELISLQGNLVRKEDGEFVVHAHVALADKAKNLHGGHLVRGIVHNTNEIILKAFRSIEAIRKRDPKSGLLALCL